MDFICKFGIYKFFPRKIWAVFYKNHNLFLGEAIAAIIFAQPRDKFYLPLNNPALYFVYINNFFVTNVLISLCPMKKLS